MNRTLSLLLKHNCPRGYAITMAYIADAELHEIAAAKLTINAEVE